MTDPESSPKDEFAVWPVGKAHYRHGEQILEMPKGWVFVPSGDAALTRRLKAGEHWLVLARYKNKVSSMGVCAHHADVSRIKAELEAQRADPAYRKKLDSGKKYRDRKQQEYVTDFRQEVLNFLAFDARWAELADLLADAVAAHATPVGSGTVARTKRIPIQERAEAAVIAWMRHQTTAYDNMYIPNGADERREVRRKLAEKSRALLDKYRCGKNVSLNTCPLANALHYKKSENNS